MIPLMTFITKLSQHQAHGTSLVAVVFTGIAGATTYSLYGNINWKIALLLTAGAIFTARLGALYAHSLPELKLKRFFGVFLILVSILLIVRGYFPRDSLISIEWVKFILILLTGILAGFVSGMMGIGGGTIMIPPMVILLGMSQQLSQGTSLLAVIPIGMMGAFTHYRLGNVALRLAPGLIIGTIIGTYFGGMAANILPELYLRVVFSTILAWIGARYVKS